MMLSLAYFSLLFFCLSFCITRTILNKDSILLDPYLRVSNSNPSFSLCRFVHILGVSSFVSVPQAAAPARCRWAANALLWRGGKNNSSLMSFLFFFFRFFLSFFSNGVGKCFDEFFFVLSQGISKELKTEEEIGDAREG